MFRGSDVAVFVYFDVISQNFTFLSISFNYSTEQSRHTKTRVTLTNNKKPYLHIMFGFGYATKSI